MSVNSSLSPDNADASSALLATLQDGALCLTTQETAPESLSQSLMPRRQDCNSHSSIGCEFKAVSNLWQKLNILSKTHGKPHDLVSDVKALHGLYQERLKVFEDGISRIVRNPEERMESSVLRKLLDVPDMRDGSLLILAVKQQQVFLELCSLHEHFSSLTFNFISHLKLLLNLLNFSIRLRQCVF
jgi:hypothetical protein